MNMTATTLSRGLDGKTVGIVGLGDSGVATAHWLRGHTKQLILIDSNPDSLAAQHLQELEFPAEFRLGSFTATTFAGCDCLVVSPGVPLATPEIAAFRRQGGEVVGDVELFARTLSPHAVKIIAITGSNGKSTVTELCGHLCRHVGLDTVVAGNIGFPVLAALLQAENNGALPDIFVLELSSFQLETTTSLNATAATVLNISEDHLNRYTDLLDYAHSKRAVFNGNGVQVLNRDDLYVRAMARQGRPIKTFSLSFPADYRMVTREGAPWLNIDGIAVFDLASFPLTGLHNAANALAALALCEACGLDREQLLVGLASFRGLPHRVEWVAKIGTVDFYDDSKGTNVGATVAALNGMSRRVVLIAGGDGKGQDFTPLAPALARIGRAVLLIGRDGPTIEQALGELDMPVERCASLEEATQKALEYAQPNDVVLLSPACASFDMFRSYAHRAEVFVMEVLRLAGEASA